MTDAKPYEPKMELAAYVGETFEDQDPRHPGRRVKVEKLLPTGKFRVRTVVNPGNPEAVARRGSLKPETIDKKYRKVSH